MPNNTNSNGGAENAPQPSTNAQERPRFFDHEALRNAADRVQSFTVTTDESGVTRDRDFQRLHERIRDLNIPISPGQWERIRTSAEAVRGLDTESVRVTNEHVNDNSSAISNSLDEILRRRSQIANSERTATFRNAFGAAPVPVFDEVPPNESFEEWDEDDEVDDEEDDEGEFQEDPEDFIPSPRNRASSTNFRRRTLDIDGVSMAEATIGELFGRNSDPSEVVKHPLVEGTSRVGIEIEVENLSSRPQRMRYWVAKGDGSLRNNGVEFVFRQPLGGNDAKAAIDEVDHILFTNKPDLNLRCSTHVHLDVRDMTVPELKRLILAYVYYETFLFRQSGEYRLKSNFCTPISFAEGLSKILGDIWNTNDSHYFLSSIVDRWDKYCGLNLLPMQSFGSIEFRMSEAKSRKGQLLRLVNRFLVLKNLATSIELDDMEFVDHITKLDITSVFRKGLVRRPELVDSDFEMSYILCNDIVNRSKIDNE